MPEGRRWGKAGVRITDAEAQAEARRERAEANKAKLLDQNRERTDAATAAAKSSTPPSHARALARQQREQATQRAYQEWRAGKVVPHRITTALDLRSLYGPRVDEACGVEEPAVDEWEEGVRYPTWEQLLALAELTGYPVAFFVPPVTGSPMKSDLGFHDGGGQRGRWREGGLVYEPEPRRVLTFAPEAIAATLGRPVVEPRRGLLIPFPSRDED